MTTVLAGTERGRYRSTGRVAWGRFLPWAALVLAVAAGVAVGLNWSYEAGYYIVILMPALGVVGLVLLIPQAVGRGRCRNAPVGLGLGLLAGLVMYGGYYYVGMVRALEMEYAGRADLLPSYVQWRMTTDVQEDVGSSRAKDSKGPDPVLNWGVLVFEAGLVLWMAGVAGYGRARRAYCEKCGQWKQREVTFYPAGVAREVADAVRGGAVEQLLAKGGVQVGGMDRRYAAVAVEYCPPASREGDEACPVYASVKDVKFGGGQWTEAQYDWAVGRMRMNREEVDEETLAKIAKAFPTTARAFGLGDAHAVAGPRTGSAGGAGVVAGRVGEVGTVPERFAGKVLTKRAIVVGNMLAMLVLLAFFAGLGLAIVGLIWMHDGRAVGLGDVRVGTVLTGAMVAVGVVIAVVSGYVGLRNPSAIGNRYLLGLARSAVRLRPDRLVKADDPAAEFCEVVPRENWEKPMLETATDVGFLLVDTRKRELRFEGDRERWKVPGEAIESAEVEEAVAGRGTAGEIRYYMVVLEIRTPAGVVERPVAVRSTKLKVKKNHREAWARAVQDRVEGIM